MKRCISFFVLIFSFFVSLAQNQDSEIQNLCSQINKDSLEANVKELQAFGSRYAFNDNRKQVAEYLCNRLNYYGFEAELDSFYLEMEYPFLSGIMNQTWQYNVVGKKRGLWAKDSTVHLGAHYDAVSFKEGFEDFINIAPGADDNASGVAALLEIARVFSVNDIKPIKTLVINFFAAEEQGLKGSNHTIRRISEPMWKENIMAMINLDMVGYCTTASDNQTVHIIQYDNSDELTDMAVEFAELYTDLIPYTSTQYNMQSDSYSYNSYGVRSVFLSEYEFTPHYHTERDVFSTLNYDYLQQQTMLATAMTYECSVHNAYGTVSLQENDAIKPMEVVLYSMPASDEIRFSLEGVQDEFTASLFDIEGRKVEEIPSMNPQSLCLMPVYGLKNGIYVLKIESGNQQVSKKITILQ